MQKEQKSTYINKYSRYIYLLAIAFFSLIIVSFFVNLLTGPIGIGSHMDTYIAVFQQHKKLWVDQTGITSKLSYFFQKSNWPHPKIVLRSLVLINETIFGYINLKWLDIVANLGLLITTLYIYFKFFKQKDTWIFLPVAAALLLITPYNFWTVASVAVGFNLLSALLLYDSFYQKKHFWTAVFLTICIFRSGAGFLVCIPLGFGVLYNLFKKQINWKHFIYYSILVAINGLIFYFITIERVLSPARLNTGVHLIEVQFIDKLISQFIFFVQLLGSFLSSRYFFDFINSYFDFAMGLIGIVLILYFIIRAPKNRKVLCLLSAAGYFLLLCAITSYLSDIPHRVFEMTNLRYTHFSLFFWLCIFTLFYLNFKEKNWFKYAVIPVVLISLFNFTNYSYNFFKDRKENYQFFEKGYFNMMVSDLYTIPRSNVKQVRQVRTKKIIHDAVKNGLHKSDFSFNFTPVKQLPPKLFNHGRVVDDLEVEFNFHEYENLLKVNLFSKTDLEEVILKIGNLTYFPKPEDLGKSNFIYRYPFYINKEDFVKIPDFKNDISVFKKTGKKWDKLIIKESYNLNMQVVKSLLKKYDREYWPVISEKENQFVDLLKSKYDLVSYKFNKAYLDMKVAKEEEFEKYLKN